MAKIILLLVALAIFTILINYLIYFWAGVKRKWKFEDDAFNEKKRKEAMDELRESQLLLEEARTPTASEDFFERGSSRAIRNNIIK